MNHCGECEACCTWLVIDDPVMPKPAGVRCGNLAGGGGCGIYEKRPTECRAFRCVWLEAVLGGKNPPPEMRPDLSGVMLDAVGPRTLAARCAPGQPRAWQTPLVRGYLERAARAGATVVISAVPRSLRKLVMVAGATPGTVLVRRERFTPPDERGEQRLAGPTRRSSPGRRS